MPAPLVGLAVGAVARAAAKKAASNAVKKAVAKAAPEKIGRTIGSATLNNKGKVVEYMSGKRVKGTARKISDNAHRAELEAKGYSKRASALKYSSKSKPTAKRVPVKKSK